MFPESLDHSFDAHSVRTEDQNYLPSKIPHLLVNDQDVVHYRRPLVHDTGDQELIPRGGSVNVVQGTNAANSNCASYDMAHHGPWLI